MTFLIPPLPRSEAEIVCGNAVASPSRLLTNGIHFAAAFTTGVDRAFWDLPLPPMPAGTSALLLDLACADPEAVRAVSVHLQSGTGWYLAETAPPASAKRQTLVLPRARFTAEGAPAAWRQARRLRLSLWKRNDRSVSLILHAVAARRDSVAVVQGGEATAPGEAAFARQMADRAGRLLAKASIPFTIVDDTFNEGLASFQLVILPWNPSLDKRRLRVLNRWVRGGGKLVVFYNANAPLAESLGFTISPWQGAVAARAWSGWTTHAEAGTPPLVVPHLTANLLTPRAAADNPFHARTVAVWNDASGRATELPACVVSSRGAWFAHVPPLAASSACDFMRHLVNQLLPGLGAAVAAEMARAVADHPHPDANVQTQAVARLAEALAARDSDRVARLAAEHVVACAAARLASAPPPLAGEIRAAWENGNGLLPSQWEPRLAELARHGINTVFYHLQSGGLLHLKTADDLPRSIRGEDPLAPRLSELLKASEQHGISLHAWITCWSLDDMSEAQRATLAASDRLMRDAEGNNLPWLCPSHPENQKLVRDGIAAWVRNGVPGIHLDYIRYPEQGCYAAATRASFERVHGETVDDWPRAVLAGGALTEAFQAFRRQEIAHFVKSVADTARQINPNIVLSAAVFPVPDTARALGQDWPAWLQEKQVDYVCPMTYTENASTFSAWIDACRRATPDAADRLVAGLGTGADESQIDVLGAVEQIAATRVRRLKGFAFFAVDSELLDRVLPALSLARSQSTPPRSSATMRPLTVP